MFKNKYDRVGLIEVTSPTGDGIRIKRGWIYEDGELVYKDKGLTNVYEEIQASKDSVDIHAIMQRYENGDATALDRVQGMYIDTIDLPKNYAQLYDAVSKADMVFDAMPAEIKQKYNNNAATFWKNYGAEEFDNIINNYRKETLARYGMDDLTPIKTVSDDIKPIKPTVENEVNNNEQKSE